MTWNCDATQNKLLDYLYNELSAEEHAACDAHIAICEKCAAEVKGFQQVRSVQGQLPTVELFPAIVQRLSTAAAQAEHLDRRSLWQKLWDRIPVIAAHPVMSSAAVVALAIGLSVYVSRREDFTTTVAEQRSVSSSESSSDAVMPQEFAPAPVMVTASPEPELAEKAQDSAAAPAADVAPSSPKVARKPKRASGARGEDTSAPSSFALSATEESSARSEGGGVQSVAANAPSMEERADTDYAQPPQQKAAARVRQGQSRSAFMAAKPAAKLYSADPLRSEVIQGDESETDDVLWRRASRAVSDKRCGPALNDFTKLIKRSKRNLPRIERTIGSCRSMLEQAPTYYPELAKELLE